ncbi:hypothetical protein Ait01nite_066570 [Actinoplanes italicus]|uniref:Pyrroloquinoline-quinone binding quinoprotein n=1 Tax=Actinoplanes italicus TaxID=113567 RepID=A0A2T0KQL2_9ACTN|nr:hypothetical protein [Actinoplanes italicus]PRX26027.1 hypothetical protein CLV67_101755 [Actinoplanes italicus]GIE33612.1 hypothetical protein Ait01nite_066570 [Actinoplanes italicus]
MRVFSRKLDNVVEVYDTNLDLVRTFAVPSRSTFKEPGSEGHAVTRSRDRLIYATDTAVLKVDPDGREEWRFDLGERGPRCGVSFTDVELSADDSLVWVYAPNAMADRDREDEWIVLDAATGELRERHVLPTVGHGGDQYPLSDGRMLLEVGEGQDGIQIYLGTPGAAPHDYGWGDRSLHGVSPDETRFVTVGHDAEDLAVHGFPRGEVLFRCTLSAFGYRDDEEDVFVEWSPGFLDDDTVVAVVSGIDDEEDTEWWRHFRVDARTGEVLGELEITTLNQYDMDVLGDGTYVITDTDGTLRRM